MTRLDAPSAAIVFPAVLAVEGDAALAHIADAAALREQMPCGEGDRLFDSAGKLFGCGEQGFVCLGDASLDELNQRLREHAALEGQCCIAKLWLPSFAQAIDWVSEMED